MTKNASSHFAKSLLQVALKNGVEERVFKDLEALTKLGREAEVRSRLEKVSFLPFQEIRRIMASLFEDRLQPLVLNLLVILLGQRNIALLPEIFATYRKLYFKEKNILPMTIVTARPLGDEEKAALTQKFQDLKNQPLHLEFQENPELIGGIQIFEKTQLVDFSVKNYLETLKKALSQESIIS